MPFCPLWFSTNIFSNFINQGAGNRILLYFKRWRLPQELLVSSKMHNLILRFVKIYFSVSTRKLKPSDILRRVIQFFARLLCYYQNIILVLPTHNCVGLHQISLTASQLLLLLSPFLSLYPLYKLPKIRKQAHSFTYPILILPAVSSLPFKPLYHLWYSPFPQQ